MNEIYLLFMECCEKRLICVKIIVIKRNLIKLEELKYYNKIAIINETFLETLAKIFISHGRAINFITNSNIRKRTNK